MRERAGEEGVAKADDERNLRVISDALSRSFERLVQIAAKRETDSLIDVYLKLAANTSPEAAVLPPTDSDTAKSTREAFGKMVLP